VNPPTTTADAIRSDVERALRRLRRGADPAGVLDELSRRLTNKLLHAPLRALQRQAKAST
jgi:glutamyl-tRNA reductase